MKLALAGGKVTLSVNNPDSGSATEELEAEYDSDPLDIGFNSRYLLDIASQIEGETAVLKLADPGSPTLIQDKDGARRALRADADAGVVGTQFAGHVRARSALSRGFTRQESTWIARFRGHDAEC